ncbi:MAG: hypothetical protein QM802_21690 [Agriterribacter sp.]
MKRYTAFFVILILLQAGCKTAIKTPISGLWVYTYYAGLHEPDPENATTMNFIELRDDGTYTRNFGTFDYGRWQQKDTILILSVRNKGAVNCSIRNLEEDELLLKITGHPLMDFRKKPNEFANPDDNPFSVANNQWRIPATKKESDAEIKNRLKNHLHFYEMYFKWGLDSKLSTVDARGTPSLIKMYGNGVVLRPYDQLPAAWQSFFYDSTDCRKANDIMKAVFNNNKIVWEHKEHKYKMFLSAFQQLQQFIK